MSTATYAPTLTGADATISRPGMPRLTLVEMRKMVDTRAGRWLVGITALIALAVVVINLFAGPDDGRTFATFFEISLYPMAFLLPILGILLVTTEWSQRTAMTTFALTPRRSRIALAKILAGAVYGLLAVPLTYALAALGTGAAVALDRAGADPWSTGVSTLGNAVLFQVLNVLLGVGFGMVLLNTPAAIVLSLLLPTAWQILGALVTRIQDAALWLDINAAMEPLGGDRINAEQYQHLATAAAVWILLPLVLGTLRLTRRELK